MSAFSNVDRYVGRVRERYNSQMMYSPSNSNGYHHNQHQHPPTERRPGMSHRERVRRGPRGGGSRSRDSRDSHDGSCGGLRVSDQKRRPCTDFDMAYFHSYAHVGIHEEMIKVFRFSLAFATSYFRLQFFFFI